MNVYCVPLTELQGHPTDSGTAVSGGATQLSQVWGQPVRRETQQLPRRTARPTVRTHAGIHQTQQTVRHPRGQQVRQQATGMCSDKGKTKVL